MALRHGGPHQYYLTPSTHGLGCWKCYEPQVERTRRWILFCLAVGMDKVSISVSCLPINIAKSWWELQMRNDTCPQPVPTDSQSLQNVDIFLIVTWKPTREFRIITIWLQRVWCFPVPRFQDHCPSFTTISLTIVKASLSSVHHYSLKKVCVLAEMLASVFAGIPLWTCGYI